MAQTDSVGQLCAECFRFAEDHNIKEPVSNSIRRSAFYNAYKCDECGLYTHPFCKVVRRQLHSCSKSVIDVSVMRKYKLHESCTFCCRREMEVSLAFDQTELNEALLWIWWHAQKTVGIQNRLLAQLYHMSSSKQFSSSEDFVIFVRRTLCHVLSKRYQSCEKQHHAASRSLCKNYSVDKATNLVYSKINEVTTKEVRDFQQCQACFRSRHMYADLKGYWISNVCSEAHLLVFAKCLRFPFWPAKVISVIPKEERATEENTSSNAGYAMCLFFGSANKRLVSAKNCYLLSAVYPENEKEPNSVEYNRAQQQLQRHLEKLRSIYEHFHLAPPNITIRTDRQPLLVNESIFFDH